MRAVPVRSIIAEGRVSALGGTAIQDRIAARLVNKAATCLQDEVIRNPGDGDVGLVFGMGFAPFKGGLSRYLNAVGVTSCVDRMHGLAETLGPQFEPCQLLKWRVPPRAGALPLLVLQLQRQGRQVRRLRQYHAPG